jgi:hypothetical protein
VKRGGARAKGRAKPAARAKPKSKAKPAARAKPKAKPASRAKPKPKPKAAARPKAKATARLRRQRVPAAPLPSRLPRADKPYKLSAAKVRPIAQGHGACIASDKITVDGHPVRFMYRERAIHAVDSGWRFLSGLESDAYMEDAGNHAFYDCNTIANYDRSIVTHLEAPTGSVFEKPPGAAQFSAVTDWSPLRA